MCTCGKDIKYKDISSFLLGVLQKRLILLIRDFNLLYGQYCRAAANASINKYGITIKEKYEREFVEFSKSIVEVLFYFLCCDMRMSTSLKVVSIINKLQLFVRGTYTIDECSKSDKFPEHYIEKLDEKISDEIASLFLNTTPENYNLMEILNILEVEKTMQVKNQISPKVINDFWRKCKENALGLNFFTVFEMIHFIKDAEDYKELKQMLFNWIDEQIRSLNSSMNSSAEAVLTFLETMCCPWIDNNKKKEYARLLCEDASDKIYNFAKKQKDIFIKWHGYKPNEAIQQIHSAEVY